MKHIPLPLLNGDTLLIDSSSTSDVMTCKRLAEYAFCRHLSSANEKPALKAGGIVHKVLETRYRVADPATGYEQTPEVEAAMVGVAENEFGRWQPPEDDFRNYSAVVSLIHEYGFRYPREPFTIVSLPDGRPFLETPFVMPFCELTVNGDFLVQELQLTPEGIVHNGVSEVRHLTTIRVAWIGRIDMVYASHGDIYVMDHKTSSMATNTGEFTISHQFYGYAAAAEYLLGRPITGFTINRLVWRKPTRTGTPFTFERILNPVSRELLAEWRQDIIHIIADLVESIRRGYMQKETTWCYGKFGECPFHKVCTLNTPAQRDILLSSGEFTTNMWTPLI